MLCYSYSPLPQLVPYYQVAPLASRGCHGRILGYALSWYCTASLIDVNASDSNNCLSPAYIRAILISPRWKMFLYFLLWFRFSGYFPFLPVDDWLYFVTVRESMARVFLLIPPYVFI